MIITSGRIGCGRSGGGEYRLGMGMGMEMEMGMDMGMGMGKSRWFDIPVVRASIVHLLCLRYEIATKPSLDSSLIRVTMPIRPFT